MENEMLRQLYERFSKEIYLYLYSFCLDRETARDLMQEVFLKALLSLEGSSQNLKAWLYKVARNTCLNYLRDQKWTKMLDENDKVSTDDPVFEKLLVDEKKKMLYLALSRLPERKREILELYYFSGMSVKEIAVLMKLTPENVRVLAHRAKREVKKYMEEDQDDI